MPSIPKNIYSFQKYARAYLKEAKHVSFDEAHKRRAYWANQLLADFRVEYEVKGREKLDANRPCVYVANHTSILDAIVLCSFFDYDVRFLAKKILFRIPIVSRLLTVEKHIPVDRSAHDRSHLEELKRLTAEAFKEGGCVLFFPEGTRTSTGKIGPFKMGAFYNSVQNNIPVVPIIIRGLFELCPKTTLAIKPGKGIIEILDPVMPPAEGDEKSRVEQLSRQVRDLMIAAHEAKPDAGGTSA